MLDQDRRELRDRRRLVFGDRLRELRRGRGMSQEQLALAAGVDRTHLVAVERGYRSILLDRVHELADALGVSASELLSAGGEDEPQQPPQRR